MRQLCPRCRYPKTTCVCHAVRNIDMAKELVVIQHYKEGSHAKNTVRLASLCLPALRVYPVKTDADIAEIGRRYSRKKCALIYPHESSLTIDHEHVRFQQNNYDVVLFIDGSWKQSKGIFNRLIKSLSCDIWQLSNAHIAKYRIRHTQLDGAFSTIEAMALSLELGLSVDTSPLNDVFEAFQNHWRGPQNTGCNKQ